MWSSLSAPFSPWSLFKATRLNFILLVLIQNRLDKAGGARKLIGVIASGVPNPTTRAVRVSVLTVSPTGCIAIWPERKVSRSQRAAACAKLSAVKSNRIPLVALLLFAALPSRAQLKSPEIHADGSATLRLASPNAEKVELLGDWRKPGETIELARGDDGVWAVTVDPLDPGAYESV